MRKKLQNYLVRAYTRRIKRRPDSLAFMPLANEYKKCGRLKDAIRLVRAGLKRYPYYTGARALSGELLFLSGRLDDAESELKAVAEKSSGHFLSRSILLEIYQNSGKNEEALKCLGELSKLCPASPDKYSVIEKELRKKIADSAGQVVKKERVDCAEGGPANVEDNDSLRRLEQLFKGIKSEAELRTKVVCSFNDSRPVDWVAFQEENHDLLDSGSRAGAVPALAGSKWRQLEIFEKMLLNIRNRVDCDL